MVAFQVAEILAVLMKSTSISIEGGESLVFKSRELLYCQSASVKLGFFSVSYCEWDVAQLS